MFKKKGSYNYVFSYDEIKIIYNLLKFQYVSYENLQDISLIRQIRESLKEEDK